MRPDNWGWCARFGILVIDKDPVAEAELWAMAPPGVTLHAARFESPRPPGSDSYGTDPARTVAESPDVARGLGFLGQMRLDAICLCFTTSSFFGGYGFDDGFIREASAKAHGTPVTTSALATVNAMRATGMRNPYLVMTPWFKDAIVEAAEKYVNAAGFGIAGVHRFDLGVGWRDMQPWEIWDHGGQWVVQPEEVYRQVRRTLPAGADGVVVAGNGFRAVDTIEPLERDLGVPVVTSNQACLWHCLRIAGTMTTTSGYGRLLSTTLPVSFTP
ncbi:MAG: hypothetical protein ACM30G_18500 [Micromonosporaceae bacterium]